MLKLLMLVPWLFMYPQVHLPVERIEGWSQAQVEWTEWDTQTEFYVWNIGPGRSACIEYWAEWSWRHNDEQGEGGADGVVTTLIIKRVVTTYNRPFSKLSMAEYRACTDLEDH